MSEDDVLANADKAEAKIKYIRDEIQELLKENKCYGFAILVDPVYHGMSLFTNILSTEEKKKMDDVIVGLVKGTHEHLSMLKERMNDSKDIGARRDYMSAHILAEVIPTALQNDKVDMRIKKVSKDDILGDIRNEDDDLL